MIFFDGTFDLGPEEEAIELGEDSEHFISIGCSTEFFLEFFCDKVFSNIDLVVEFLFCSCKFLVALFGYIENIDTLEEVVSILNIGRGEEVFFS